VDDIVVIRETNFKNMKGRVAEVDDLRWQITVMVEFMGRTTPVSLSFDKVELA
jgi:transcription antitermination factor NusG